MEDQRIPKNTDTRWEEHWCHLRNAKELSLPQINSRWSPFSLHWLHSYPVSHIIQNKWLDFLYETTEIPWDIRLKSMWILIPVQHFEESSMHPTSSQDESWFPVYVWRGEPTFHKHLKWSFPSAIGLWKGPCVFCLKWNGPREALIKKKAGFPCIG